MSSSTMFSRPVLACPAAEPPEPAAEIQHTKTMQVGQQRTQRRPFGRARQPVDRAG